MSYFCCHRFYNNTKHNKKMADCAMDIEAIEIDGDLIPCHVCGRTFLSAPLKKHIKICEKNASKKRRVFDSSKQRVEGTELAPFHQSVKKPNSDTKTEIIKTNWKEKHEKLVEAIRAAKSNKPPTANMAPRRSISASGTMGYTSRCPSCDRQFGPKAFDRHVEWCKEHKSRPTNSPANVQLAKERLEARTKYKVPPLNKSKRYQTREKYKPNLRNDSQVSLEKIETERKKSEPIIKKKQQVQDKLIKEKSKSTTNNKVNYNPFLVAEKQLLDLLNDDTPSPSSTITKTPNTPLKSIKNPPKIFQKHPPKRISVIEPPQDFSDKLNVLQDNFELIENFINDNFDKNVILTHRKYSDDNTTIDPSLINEIDNLDLPEKIYDENLSPISINHNLEGQNITKRSQSVQNNHQALDEIDLEQLISSFDDDDTFPTLKTFLQTKNPEKIQKSTTSLNSSCGIDNKSLTSLKRSVSLQNPAIKARSLVKKQDITDYLHEKVPKNNPNIVKPAKNFDELFPENHELYDEYKRFEEEYKRDIKMASGDESSNDESRLPRKTINKGKLSGDSAYGSLNRKLSVPKRGVSIERSSSSSGSETPMKAKISNNKLSKYCHECGFKYPVDSAKFCVECGIKRLVL